MKNRKTLVTLLALQFIIYFAVKLIWARCPVTDCSVDFIDNYLATLEMASLVLAAYFIFFLFLPTRYFEAWLKKIFSWAFPVAFISVLATQESGGVLAVSKAEVVVLNGVFFGVVTLLFVLFRWWKTRRTTVVTK